MIPPVATYRLQLREGMTLDRAREEVVPHAHALGASHLYLSPPFEAAPGSTHGYDVTRHDRIEPALGGREALERLSEALRGRGMGLMIDIVPNHMAADLANPWWRDVVARGGASAYARHFDVDWSEPLTLPVLGRPFEEALAEGEVAVRADGDRGLALAYHDNLCPLAPGTYRILSDALGGGLGALTEAAEAGDAGALARALTHDPAPALSSADAALIARLHEAQPYRLTHWVTAARHLSYRRFFEVTGLVGVRVEDEAVFDDVHRLILELVREGVVDGLRIDHVDGLRDPGGYLRRLRAAAPGAWIVVEKITEGQEALPADWPIEGTTGYEFIAALGDLMVPAEGAERLEEAHTRLAGEGPPEALRREIKRRIVTRNFEGELRAVARALTPHLDADEAALMAALAEVIVEVPVYRTYGDGEGLRPEDRALLSEAAARAGGDLAARAAEALGRPEAWEARARFQQLTGPAMAKSVEDTLFYRANGLIARNEVGCDPVEPPGGRAAVHAALARRVDAPHALTATATHDTKRGEDARARLHALAEAPEAWIRACEAWRTEGEPEPAVQWLLLQSMLGAWGEGLAERFPDYVRKALREAKARTTWTEPDEPYEEAAIAWASERLGDAGWRAEFEAAAAPFVAAGHVGAVVQAVLKVTAPGVPDVYQGTEGLDLSLVDPDNRRPPDWGRLARLITPGPAAGAPPDRRKALALARAMAVRAERPDLFSGGDYAALEAPAPDLFAFERRLGADRAVVVVPIRPLALASTGPARWGEASMEVGGLTSRLADAPGPAPSRVADLLGGLPAALLTCWK